MVPGSAVVSGPTGTVTSIGTLPPPPQRRRVITSYRGCAIHLSKAGTVVPLVERGVD